MSNKRLTVRQRRCRRRRGGARAQKTCLAPGDYLMRDQVARVLRYCRHQAKTGSARAAVNLMIVEFLLYTGVRVTEMCGIEIQDLPIIHGKHEIYVHESFAKRGKPRTVIIGDKLVDRLKTYTDRFHKRRKRTAPLFINEQGRPMEAWNVYRRIKRIGVVCGVSLSPHKFRHTFATYLRQQSEDLAFVKDQLGHSRIETTTIYSKTLNASRIRQVQGLDFG